MSIDELCQAKTQHLQEAADHAVKHAAKTAAEIMADAHKSAADSIQYAKEHAEMLLKLQSDFSKSIQEYSTTGITLISRELRSALQQYADTRPKSFFRELASALKRPYIYAEEMDMDYYNNPDPKFFKIELRMTKSERLADVASSFLLLAKEYPDEPNWRAQHEGPVTRCDTGGTWRIYFNNEVGHQVFNAFVTKVRTNPVARIILKLK